MRPNRTVYLTRHNALRFEGADDLAPLAIDRIIVERVCALCLVEPVTYELEISQPHGQPAVYVRNLRTSYAGGHLCVGCAARVKAGAS